MKMLILSTFRNESEVVGKFLRRVDSVVSSLDFVVDVLLVDDYSSDNSKNVVQKFAQGSTLVIKYIRTVRRFGVGPCMLLGLKQSTEYDCVVYLDTDLQDPPELIPQLVDAYRGGAKIVHTRRLSRDGESRFKLFLTGIAYKLIHLVNRFSAENMGDFKLLDREVVKQLLNVSPKDTYLRGMVQWLNYPSVVVDYNREARSAGDTKFSLFSSLNPYLELFRGLFSFSASPLILVSIFSAGMTFLLLAAVVLVVSLKFVGITPPGWATLAVIPSLVGACVSFTQMTLCVYVARIYEELNKFNEAIILEELVFNRNK